MRMDELGARVRELESKNSALDARARDADVQRQSVQAELQKVNAQKDAAIVKLQQDVEAQKVYISQLQKTIEEIQVDAQAHRGEAQRMRQLVDGIEVEKKLLRDEIRDHRERLDKVVFWSPLLSLRHAHPAPRQSAFASYICIQYVYIYIYILYMHIYIYTMHDIYLCMFTYTVHDVPNLKSRVKPHRSQYSELHSLDARQKAQKDEVIAAKDREIERLRDGFKTATVRILQTHISLRMVSCISSHLPTDELVSLPA